MKKNFIIMAMAAMLLVPATEANAQISLGSVLKSAASSVLGDSSSKSTSSSSMSSSTKSSGLLSALSTIFNSSNVATKDQIIGTWKYTEPAVVFDSSNALKNIGGKVASAAIEKQLQSKLSKVGIKKGTMTMTFDKDGNFIQKVGNKSVKGTYEISGKNVTLKYAGQVKQLVGTTQVVDGDLLMVMDASKLLTFMKTAGSLTGNSTLKTLGSLAGSMDGMKCGLRLEK